MNKCLHIGNIPRTWQNAQVILLHKKEDKLNLSNFRPISLLPLPYKLLTKMWKCVNEKCNEYNTPLHLKDHIQKEKNRKRTKVDDVIEHIARQKYRWMGHVARQDNDRWTRRIVQWRLRQPKRSAGRPQKGWIDNIKEIAGRKLHQMAMNRSEWKQQGEAYLQEWMQKGCWKKKKKKNISINCKNRC